ncbi:RlpA-like double-psi beta-barrel-protein domain-containing protein-containing protein [Mycena galericulata]|nr:RlpA-like double-psi beta-barrel-protein domain-containing protein-containing protein [Mycena galericulata]
MPFSVHYSPATYYDPNGDDGACGTPLQNSDFIVALGEDNWDDSANCGDTITVNYNDASIQVTVEDVCPTCQEPNGIDLSEAAMAALDPNYLLDGKITVTWSFS